MKKIKRLFLLFILTILVGSFASFDFASTNAGIFDNVFGEVENAEGDYVNNLVMFNFLGESNELNEIVPSNQVSIYNDVYNENEHSLNAYYNQVSNGKLNLTTSFFNNGDNINVLTLDKSREYFMNYCIYDYNQNSYIINEEGYFPYEIVSSSSAPDFSLVFDFQFYMQAEHYAFVYGDSDNQNYIPQSSQDGVMSYKEALEFVNSNSGYYLVDGIERYLRELELISLLDDKLSSQLSLTNCDNNNDGNIDILSFNVLDCSDKDYRVEWSEILWAHQSSLNAFLDYEISYMFFTGTVSSLLNNSLVASYIKSIIQPHIKDSSYIDTYLNYAKNRPSVSDGANSLNIDKYYLTTFDAQDLQGASSFEAYKNALNLDTTTHELGHLFGLPDLYIYSNQNSDAVGRWSLMCSNTNPPQYLTAYEREKLGWLDESNVVTISSSGQYLLNATKGYDGNNIVAYKIQNPNDSNQWFYFEYRDKTLTENAYFEQATGEKGLIVYRVDTSILSGNMYAQPYGMYVFRLNSIDDASFKENQIYGNFDINQLNNALTWQNGAGIYKNSGYAFSVLEIENGVLTFLFDTAQRDTSLSLIGESEITLKVGQDYTEQGIKIKENEQDVTYLLDSNLSKNRTYKIEYFKNSQKVDSISTNQEATFTITYTIKDSYGNTKSLSRTVIIESNVTKVTISNTMLNERLKSILGQTEFYSDSLLELDYINLSGLSLSNIDDLLKFEYKDGVVIDLTKNNISSLNQFESLFKAFSNAKVILVENNLKANDISSFSYRDNIVVGYQSDFPQIYFEVGSVNLKLNVDNDISEFYDLYVNDRKVNLDFTFNNHGTYSISLKSKVGVQATDVSKTIEIVLITQKNQNVSYSYNDIKSFALKDFIELSNFNAVGNLTYSTNYNDLKKDTLQNQQFYITLSYNNEGICNFVYNFSLFDNLAPTITVKNDGTFYLLGKSDYDNFENLYSDLITAHDEFDGDVIVSFIKPNFTSFKLYSLTCNAKDSSGNLATKTINVYVGDVSLSTQTSFEYNLKNLIDFDLKLYDESHFSIRYKLGSSTVFKFYTSDQGFIPTQFGSQTLTVQFLLILSGQTKTLSKTINVIDTTLPQVSLIGDSFIKVEIGGEFQDSGISCTDNTDSAKLKTEKVIYYNGEVVDNIDTSKTGTYTIQYKVTDLGGNISTINRTVEVVYVVFNSVTIILIILGSLLGLTLIVSVIWIFIKKVIINRSNGRYF